VDELRREFEQLAPVLNNMKVHPDVVPQYDLVSDSLFWLDELPDLVGHSTSELWCLRPLLRFRTTLIIGEPDEQLRLFWDLAHELFPSWPGLLSVRRSESLKGVYEDLKSRASSAQVR
jgi:hypothetical protein